MSSSNEKLCVQKRLLNLIKTDGGVWAIFLPLQIFSSFCVSYFLTSYYPYIPIDLSNRVLSSLIDVSIALFGFVGLILVFTFRNLLTTKGDLQKEKFEISLKTTQFDLQKASKLLHAGSGLLLMTFEEEAIKKCDVRIEEIDDDLTRNENQIKDASFLSFASLGIAFVCILMNVWTFGAVGNEGLHFFNLTVLLSLFFLWLDFVFKLIRTVIR